MLPLSDGIPARRFPIVNVSPITANFAVWIFYELPHPRIRTYIFPVLIRIPAWYFLGLWFLYQLILAFGLFGASANGGGVAFFAHVGGFIFGVLAARILTGAGRITPGRDKEMRNGKGQGYP